MERYKSAYSGFALPLVVWIVLIVVTQIETAHREKEYISVHFLNTLVMEQQQGEEKEKRS